MKHHIRTLTEHEMGRTYENLGAAINRLGRRIVKIKVDIDSQRGCSMTIWDNAPVFTLSMCFVWPSFKREVAK